VKRVFCGFKTSPGQEDSPEDSVVHGRPQKVFYGGKREDFANPCQVADDAMHTYVHKTFTLST